LQKVEDKTAEKVCSAIEFRLKDIEQKSHTITFDNGKEFAKHANIAEGAGVKCFFAHPYHSWERGLNEHTNGLVREYIPKKTDFSTVTHEDVFGVEWLLNTRPRKSLNYRTPQEVFFSSGKIVK
jgi:IS30 family transposase